MLPLACDKGGLSDEQYNKHDGLEVKAMDVYTGDISDRQGMYHWGIKGQKWGVRRFQNEDGSLTDEGKKRYMYAARHNQLNYKKLSDKDLDMINNRFKKEDTYKKNVKSYRDSLATKKVAKAAGKTAVKTFTGTAKMLNLILGKPLQQAIVGSFEDAFDFSKSKKKKKGKSEEETTDNDSGLSMYVRKKGKAFAAGYKPSKNQRMNDEKAGRAVFNEAVKYDWSTGFDKDAKQRQFTGNRNKKVDKESSEYILRSRHVSQRRKERNDQRIRDEKTREDLEKRAAKSGLVIAWHSAINTNYRIKRVKKDPDEIIG